MIYKIGYIVTGKNGPYGLGWDGLLYFSDCVALFSTYERARSAVRRTLRSADAKHFDWAKFGHTIRPVEVV